MSYLLGSVQIINNLGYVVGESKSRYQGRHHRLKLQIQEVDRLSYIMHTLRRWGMHMH